MKQCCGRLLPVMLLLLGLSACDVGALAQHPAGSPRPSVSAATPADPARCERLARRGFAPCPPAPDRLSLPPTTIRNATNGAVPDATAQQWGRAFQLAQAYYYWVMQNNARSALTSGVLADPSPNAVANLFGSDLMDLDDAKNAGGRLVYQPPGIPTTQLVTIPSSLQDAMRRQGLQPSAYGLAVRFTGPTRRSIRSADGTETIVAAHDATFAVNGLLWGQLKEDPDLGRVWYEYGNYGCDGSVRDACQL